VTFPIVFVTDPQIFASNPIYFVLEMIGGEASPMSFVTYNNNSVKENTMSTKIPKIRV
jgi:hypothetical protein